MSRLIELEALADELEESGDYAGAEKITRRIILEKIETYGPGSEVLIDDLYNLGLLCWAQNDMESARDQIEAALEICRRQFGRGNHQTEEIQAVLSMLEADTIHGVLSA